jgi:hypothetical protein
MPMKTKACENDTDGDGDCHLCAKFGGCEAYKNSHLPNPFSKAIWAALVQLNESYGAGKIRYLRLATPTSGEFWLDQGERDKKRTFTYERVGDDSITVFAFKRRLTVKYK